MKTETKGTQNPELEALIRGYLRLEPAALARLGAGNEAGRGTVEGGLHEFMRRVLERAVGFLWLPADARIRLRSKEVPGWPDPKIFNLAQLLAWGLVREPRRLRGLPQLPLYPADPDFVDLPWKELGKRYSVSQLIAVAMTLFEVDFDRMRDAPAPGEGQPVSIRKLIEEMLGVRAEQLIRPYHDTREDAEDAFARDPEGQAAAGLSAFLIQVLHQHAAISSEQTPQTDCIAFVIGDGDNEGDEDEGYAATDMRALLMAGLLADGTKEIAFIR